MKTYNLRVGKNDPVHYQRFQLCPLTLPIIIIGSKHGVIEMFFFRTYADLIVFH
jgi:hypothetical protein